MQYESGEGFWRPGNAGYWEMDFQESSNDSLRICQDVGEIPRKARDDAPFLPPPCSAQGGSVYHNVFYGKAATIFGWFDLQMVRCFAIAQHDIDMWSVVILLLAGVIYLWESLAMLRDDIFIRQVDCSLLHAYPWRRLTLVAGLETRPTATPMASYEYLDNVIVFGITLMMK